MSATTAPPITTCSSLSRSRSGGRARPGRSVALTTSVVIRFVSAPHSRGHCRGGLLVTPCRGENIPRHGLILHATFASDRARPQASASGRRQPAAEALLGRRFFRGGRGRFDHLIEIVV